MSEKALGRALGVVGGTAAVFLGILAVAWYTRMPWAVALWPWPEAPMTFVFLSSIGAAVVAAWIVARASPEPWQESERTSPSWAEASQPLVSGCQLRGLPAPDSTSSWAAPCCCSEHCC